MSYAFHDDNTHMDLTGMEVTEGPNGNVFNFPNLKADNADLDDIIANSVKSNTFGNTDPTKPAEFDDINCKKVNCTTLNPSDKAGSRNNLGLKGLATKDKVNIVRTFKDKSGSVRVPKYVGQSGSNHSATVTIKPAIPSGYYPIAIVAITTNHPYACHITGFDMAADGAVKVTLANITTEDVTANVYVQVACIYSTAS